MTATVDTIKALLIREFKVDSEKLSPGARLDELGIDSLATLEFVFEVEDAFAIKLTDADFRGTTLQDVVDSVDAVIARTGADGKTPQVAR